MFGPNTATPMLAANRLARWSLMLSQYDYTIEYRSTKQHGNADALSRLPVGPDLSFDGEEGDNDVDTVCTIRVINSQLQPHSRNQLKDATNRDPVLSEVKRYVREGWPQKIDTPDVQEFSSAEFQLWCHQRGIKHLTGAPYHPATNGAAERMVQSFKQSLKKSKLPPRPALQEFLMQYRRTPLNTGFSHSQLLNGRQLRTKIDALLPSPAHIAQEHQAREASKSQQKEQTAVQHVRTAYDVGTPCYALYCGPRQTSTPRWVPATITRVHGTRTFTVKVHPRGPLWKRHLEQLQPRYGVAEDTDPGVVTSEQSTSADSVPEQPKAETLSPPTEAKTSDHTLPEYGRHNPRRSSHQRKTRQLYNAQ